MSAMISIITIVRNDREGIERTWRSVAAQKCRDFEWIVIDGASTDGTADFVSEHSAEIASWVSEPDTGIYNAMNKGVDRAIGQYLLFLNAGDALADADVLCDFIALGTDADVVYGRSRMVDSTGREMWRWPLPPQPLRLSYFWQHALKHQSAFFSKRCFERYRYNEEHRINSDTELFMTLLYNNYAFQAWDREVAWQNGEGLSAQPESRGRMEAEFADTLRRLMPEGMRLDYQDVIMTRDVPLMQTAARITRSNRVLRTIARVLLWPVKMMCGKQPAQ